MFWFDVSCSQLLYRSSNLYFFLEENKYLLVVDGNIAVIEAMGTNISCDLVIRCGNCQGEYETNKLHPEEACRDPDQERLTAGRLRDGQGSKDT
jgi:hypothetical protein